MFLQEKLHHEMIEILSLSDLFDPFNKTSSGEATPRWIVMGQQNVKDFTSTTFP